MHLIELDNQGGFFMDAVRAQRLIEQARVGVHCSTIVNDITRKNDPKAAARNDTIDETTGLTFQELGNVVEDVIAAQLVQRYYKFQKPEPRVWRGVTGSPDGWSPRVRCIDEVKACWKSQKGFVTTDKVGLVIEESLKFISYKMQILFYMKIWNALRARLHVLFMIGDFPYGSPFPRARTFILKPTQAELDTNAEMLLQHAHDMRLL